MKMGENTPLMQDGGPSLSHAKMRTIGTFSLVAIMFFTVAGGPEGTETMIQTAGPLPTSIGIMLLGVVLAVPVSLMTVELSTAFPENGGFVLWARAAFGDSAAGTAGILQILVSCVDSALYPGLFVSYLAMTLGTDFSYLTSWLVQGLFVLAITGLNLAGIGNVGHGSVGMMLFLLLPFTIITLIALSGAFTGTTVAGWAFETSNWGDVVDGGRPVTDWGPFVIVLLWNMGWWERVSVVTGEVKDVQTVFPTSLAIAVVLVVANYMLPLMAFTGLDNDYAAYDNGYFIQIARNVGGAAWGIWLGVSQCVSTAGLFTNGVSTNSFMMCGMGEQGMLPHACSYRLEATRAPAVSIAFSVILPVIFIFIGDFKSILAVDMLFYSLSLLLEISALIYLRVKAPNLQCSWKIPLDVTGLVAMFTPTILICLYVILSATLKDVIVAVVILAVCILLLLGGYLLKGSNPELFHESQDVTHVEKLDEAAA